MQSLHINIFLSTTVYMYGTCLYVYSSYFMVFRNKQQLQDEYEWYLNVLKTCQGINSFFMASEK